LAAVSDSPLHPIYLLTGGDRPKIRRALERLRSRFGAESIETLSAQETGGDEAVTSLNALGLFAGEAGRLVIVEDVERWKKQDEDAVAAYVVDPVPGAVLALVAAELKGSSLPTVCAKAGEVLTYDVPRPRDLPGWVRAQFDRLDTQVELVAVPAHETTAWAIMDAWGARDLPAALVACQSDLERGADPFAVAMRLSSQVALVRQAQALSEEGLGVRDIAKRLRKHDFRVRKALSHAENYTRDELDEAVIRLAELDSALKGASRLAGELELERAIVELVRRPEPAVR
jgi:DNA polymerase III delta subunit